MRMPVAIQPSLAPPSGAVPRPELPSPPGTPEGTHPMGIPQLEEFGISPRTGFLPEPSEVLPKLSSEYFQPWEHLVANLSSFLLAGKLREYVKAMPVLDVSRLRTVAGYRRAFVCLSFIAHAYVWGHNEEPCDVLPASVSIPYVAVSRRLRLHPVCSFSAVVLWNYRPLFMGKPLTLDNLASIETFTGAMDESWFYLISCAIEAAGARALPAITEGMEASVRGDVAGVIKTLKVVEEVIEEITGILMKMYQGCDPHIFYYRIRKFLAAWAGNPLLPDGVLYEGVDDIPEYEIDGSVEKDLEGFSREFRKPFEELDWTVVAGACRFDDEELHDVVAAGRRPSRCPPPPQTPRTLGVRRKFAGGSAAQSPIIQALDIALGVEHRPQFPFGKPPTAPDSVYGRSPHSFESPKVKNFIHEMRAYLPGPVRSFLLALSRAPSIRAFVQEQRETNPAGAGVMEMTETFNRCVDGMKRFRDKHVQMVSVFILIQGKKRRAEDGVAAPGGGSSSTTSSAGLGAAPGESKGTGGTNILPFLRQTREETKSAQI